MDPITTATLAWLASTSALVALTGVVYRSFRRTRARVRAERVRSAFAEARTDLVLLALQGGIATDSATYRTLYFLNTAVMRRDDQYDHLWPAFLNSVNQVNDPTHVNPMREESKSWTPDVARVALRTCSAMEVMLVEHSLLLRGLFKLTGGLVPYLVAARRPQQNEQDNKMLAVTARIEDFEARHEPARLEVRRFQAVLRGPSHHDGPSTFAPC